MNRRSESTNQSGQERPNRSRNQWRDDDYQEGQVQPYRSTGPQSDEWRGSGSSDETRDAYGRSVSNQRGFEEYSDRSGDAYRPDDFRGSGASRDQRSSRGQDMGSRFGGGAHEFSDWSRDRGAAMWNESDRYAQSGSMEHGSGRGSNAFSGERGGGMSNFRGRAPKGYVRSDERLKEDICERLGDDSLVDASDISVECKDGTVTLSGSVSGRWIKHRVEDIVDACSGVKEIDNRLSIKSSANDGQGASGQSPGGSDAGAFASASGDNRGRDK